VRFVQSRDLCATLLKCERKGGIFYDVLRICNEKKKNKGLITPLEGAIVRTVKTDGKCERVVKM
jgi:hypothetical protein